MTRSSVATTGFAVLVLATALVAVTPSFAATAPTPNVSFRNSRPLMPLDLYRSFLTSARALSCQPALPPGIKPPPSAPPRPSGPRRVSSAAAIATASRSRASGASAARKLQGERLPATAVGAERLAAAGIIRGSGKGALAALLVAAGRQPARPAAADQRRRAAHRRRQAQRGAGAAGQGADPAATRSVGFDVPTLALLETNRAAALFRTGPVRRRRRGRQARAAG